MNVDWNLVVWSLMVGLCLAFGAIHFIIACMQFRQREVLVDARKIVDDALPSPFLPAGEWASLGLAGLAFSLAAITLFELVLMHTQTPADYGRIQRWIHVPFLTLVVSLVVFVRTYFRAGRLWLGGCAIGLRAVGSILNFSFATNINYTAISAVKQVETFTGSIASIAVGVRNPWLAIMEISSLLIIVFIIDAVVTCWRRGGKVERRRAAFVGSALALMAVFMVSRALLIGAGIVEGAYMLGFPFLLVFAALSFEFGADMVRSVRLAARLQKSEAALRLSERRMALASDAAHLGMWEWDSGRGEFWASGPCRALYGFAADQAISYGKVYRAVHPDDRHAWSQQLKLSLQGVGMHEVMHRVLLPDGAVRWIDVRGRVEKQGRQGAVIRGVSLDVTERKRAEFELEQQRNELAHLSRVTMLGELSGSLAHELNQPLTAILSNAQAALRFIASDDEKIGELREILHDIVADDRRAGEVIQGLRDLLKKGERKNEALDVNAAVQSVIRLTRSDLLNASIVIGMNLAGDLPPAIGDPVQLQQVLLNLVINACDAMSANAVDDRQLLLGTRLAESGEIEVCIRDQGHSIAPDQLESVFMPFFTTKKEGLGLGLVVCRQIVTAHGGRLWAQNNAGKGASFFFTLPAGAATKP